MKTTKYLSFLLIFILSASVGATNILPETRTVVEVSNTDINRVSCIGGEITSVDYAGGTGLTHTTHDNGESVIFLFRQLDNGRERKTIAAQVSLLISCNNEYYSILLDPKNIESQTIHLTLPTIEKKAKNNKNIFKKEKEQILVDLIKKSRTKPNQTNINQKTDSTKIFIDGGLQLQPIDKEDIYGTHYQILKYIVISSPGPAVEISEKMFLTSQISEYKIVALSLDDYQLNKQKSWTTLYVVVNKGGF